MCRREEFKKSLTKELDDSSWEDIRLHISRDAVVLIDVNLDIIEVGIDLALDNVKKIDFYIKNNQLTKPSIKQINRWENKQDCLHCLIIQPFIIVQNKI